MSTVTIDHESRSDPPVPPVRPAVSNDAVWRLVETVCGLLVVMLATALSDHVLAMPAEFFGHAQAPSVWLPMG